MTSIDNSSVLENGISLSSSQDSTSPKSAHDGSLCGGSDVHRSSEKHPLSRAGLPSRLTLNAGHCQRYGQRPTQGSKTFFSRHFVWIIATVVLLALIITLLSLVSQLQADRIPVSDVQQILATGGTRGVRGRPTSVQAKRSGDFDSTGIKPIQCHSHNDYERKVPLYDALNIGCISVEADIWLQNGELLIGHEKGSTDPARTLKSLYLDPLVSILSDRNPDLDLNDGTDHSGSLKGVFSADDSVSLVLLVDIKTESGDTLAVLMDQLSPLADQRFLTHFDGSQIIQGPLTIVGTGNTNFDTIYNEKDRNILFDAPLDNDWSEDSPASKAYNKDNSYYASVSFDKSIGKPSFSGDLSDEQIGKVKNQIQGAHKRGLKVRYYDTPNGFGEESTQERLWQEGVDVLNRDDLEAAKEFLEKQGERS